MIPVIATVQQLSNGLCRLYGVEPGRLKLSGLLEASRGAVGIPTTFVNNNSQHFVDDSQPLLDDEVFKNSKSNPSPSQKTVAAEPVKRTVPTIVVDPNMAAAVNLLGLRLTLARNRAEAADMATERLKDFGVTLKVASPDLLTISWSGQEVEVDLSGKRTTKTFLRV